MVINYPASFYFPWFFGRLRLPSQGRGGNRAPDWLIRGAAWSAMKLLETSPYAFIFIAKLTENGIQKSAFWPYAAGFFDCDITHV